MKKNQIVLTLQHLKYAKILMQNASIGQPHKIPDTNMTMSIKLSKCRFLVGLQALLSREQVAVETMQQYVQMKPLESLQASL